MSIRLANADITVTVCQMLFVLNSLLAPNEMVRFSRAVKTSPDAQTTLGTTGIRISGLGTILKLSKGFKCEVLCKNHLILTVSSLAKCSPLPLRRCGNLQRLVTCPRSHRL